MLYMLLVAVIGWVLVRMWTSPVQVVALVLTMHGARQIAVATLPQVSASPFMMNLAVAVLVAIALGLSALRGRDALPSGSLLCAWGVAIAFYAYYFTYAAINESFVEESFLLLILQVAPYIVLQLLAMTTLVAASSPDELRSALSSTWCICLLIIGIALTDNSVRVGGDDSSFRLMLRTQQDESQGSNPLALADVGVMLMAITLHVMPGVAQSFFPSMPRVGWLAALLRWARLALVGALGVMILWISRGEPILALLAMVITTFTTRGGGRNTLVIACPAISLLAIFSGAAQHAFDLLVEWFPRLGTVDEGVSVRQALVERLLDQYASGGFSVLLFGLGPGYSLSNLGLYPHNQPIECLTELGIVGLTIAVIGPINNWRRGWVLLQESTSGAIFQNASFFQTMLTFSMLVSLKRGSVVQPDIFTWSAVLAFLHAAGSRPFRVVDRTRLRPSKHPSCARQPRHRVGGSGPQRLDSPRHRHAIA